MKRILVYSELTEEKYEFGEYDIRNAILSKIKSKSSFDLKNHTFEYIYAEDGDLLGAKVVVSLKSEKGKSENGDKEVNENGI